MKCSNAVQIGFNLLLIADYDTFEHVALVNMLRY